MWSAVSSACPAVPPSSQAPSLGCPSHQPPFSTVSPLVTSYSCGDNFFLYVKSLPLAFDFLSFLPGSSSKVSLFAQQLHLEPSGYGNPAGPVKVVLLLWDLFLFVPQCCHCALRVEPWCFVFFFFHFSPELANSLTFYFPSISQNHPLYHC